MSEELVVDKNQGRLDAYRSLLPQLIALTENEPNTIANLANISAALRQAFDFFWVGFYIVTENVSLQERNLGSDSKNMGEELVLGPFQGDIACTRIKKGDGVCGTAWLNKEIVIVPDVDQFEGHIACSNASRSEIVLPILKNGVVIAILDVDSDQLDDFSDADEEGLSNICSWVSSFM